MEANFETINKKSAMNLLRFNTENRKEKPKHIYSLAEEMKSGRWKENGQPIIIAEDGTLLDGQNRLRAIALANYTGKFLVVRGVDKKSKVTIDTGVSRRLQDVLQMEGFASPNETAALIKRIIPYDKGVIPDVTDGNITGSPKQKVTNSRGLDFAKENKEELLNNIKFIISIKRKTKDKTITAGFASSLLYMIGGFEFSTIHLTFIKTLFGINTEEDSAAHWIRKTVLKAKERKDIINTRWLYGVCINAWNLYINGNPAVRYIKYDTTRKLPKPEKLITVKELETA